MRAQNWSRRLLAAATVLTVSATGCKTLNERYIAMEVWKYEKCFGHLPPGFTPPGAVQAAAAPAPRVCGQQQQQCCDSAPVASGCNSCEGGGAVVHEGMPAGAVVPGGPGGSPGPAATLPTPAGVTAGKPVVISDEVVIP
jgi:hypothetical protein